MAPFRALASVIIVGFMSFPLLLGMVLLEHDAEDRGTAHGLEVVAHTASSGISVSLVPFEDSCW